MKKILTFFLAISFLGGCAADRAAYREGADINYLDFGACRVGIDKKFEFIGEFEAANDAESVEGVLEGRAKINTYVFADTGKGKAKISRAIAVTAYTLTDHGYWSGEADFAGHESGGDVQVLHNGTTEINGIPVAVVVFATEKLVPKIFNMAGSRGYVPLAGMKQNIDVKFGRVIDRSRMVHIEYIEVSDENYPDAFEYMIKAKKFITLEKR